MNGLVVLFAVLWVLTFGAVLCLLVDTNQRLSTALEFILPAGGEDQ